MPPENPATAFDDFVISELRECFLRHRFDDSSTMSNDEKILRQLDVYSNDKGDMDRAWSAWLCRVSSLADIFMPGEN